MKHLRFSVLLIAVIISTHSCTSLQAEVEDGAVIKSLRTKAPGHGFNDQVWKDLFVFFREHAD